jgi:putative peptidoglycan lipid II flippase
LTVKRQVLRSASVIALVTAISRICGYLRDQRVALLLGTSPAADAFILAFRIPSLIRRMTGENSLGASFIPVFSSYLRDKSRSDAWAFAQKMFWDMAVMLAVIAVLGAVFSRQVIYVFTIFGGENIHWDLAIYLNRIIFPAVFFIGLAALAAAILNSFRVFGLPAATPIFFNLIVIGFSFGILYRPILRWAPDAYRTPAVGLAVGILVGGAVQLAIQIPALVRLGMPMGVSLSLSDPGVRKVGLLLGPSFFGMSVYQVNLLVDTIFATSHRMPSGSVTSLYIADRVMQLVLGSYAIAMSTALLPTLSQQAAAGQFAEMKSTFGFSLRVVSFIAIPAAVGLVLLRQPIIQVLFQHGRFGTDSTGLTAHALLFYSMGLPAFAAIKLITPMYYSMQDTMTPARVGAWALGMNVALNSIFLLLFVGRLSNGTPALASAITAYFNFGLLLILFRKRHGVLGVRGLALSFGRITACAAVMAAVAYGGLVIWRTAPIQHVLVQAGALAAMIFASVAAYMALAWLLKCEELSELLLLFRRVQPGAVPVMGAEV